MAERAREGEASASALQRHGRTSAAGSQATAAKLLHGEPGPSHCELRGNSISLRRIGSFRGNGELCGEREREMTRRDATPRVGIVRSRSCPKPGDLTPRFAPAANAIRNSLAIAALSRATVPYDYVVTRQRARWPRRGWQDRG